MSEAENLNHRDAPGGYLFLDLETGGLNSELHSILQVAAVLTDADLKIQGTFMSYVKPHPKLQITPEALQINQLSLEELATAPDEIAVARALHHFALLGEKPRRFAGYNCKFDLPFLDGMWRRQDFLQPPYAVPWLDVYDIVKSKLEVHALLSDFKLISVAKHLGFDPAGAHDAGADLMMTIKIARRLREYPDRTSVSILETARFS